MSRTMRRLRVWWCGVRGHDWRRFESWAITYAVGHHHRCMTCHARIGTVWDWPESSRTKHCPVCRPA